MVPTRWNSKYEMLERMKKLRTPLSQVLSNCTTMSGLTGIEWKQIHDIIIVLKPLYEATLISCGAKYPTLSSVEPILYGIETTLNKFESDDMNNEAIDGISDQEDDENCINQSIGIFSLKTF